MIVDGDRIIQRQLSAVGTTQARFDNGQTTRISPARYVPILDDEEMSVSLDGEWRVTTWPFARQESVLVDPQTGTGQWDRIEQPGPVFHCDPEQNPGDVKDWDRVGLSHIDPEDGAILRKRVTIPIDWDQKCVFLRFDSIYPAGRIYVEGELVLEHLSGLTPAEVEITDKVKVGKEIEVAVRLLRTHDKVKLDMPRHAMEFAGLAQHARIFAVDDTYISDYKLASDLDLSSGDGVVQGTVWIHNASVLDAEREVTLTVHDPEGRQVASIAQQLALKSGDSAAVEVEAEVPDVLQWNDEAPNLYQVELRLGGLGLKSYATTFATAFRRFEVTPDGPRLNGNPVKFRGVNHLTFHPRLGMYTPKAWLRQNFKLMKKANVNCIRTHFLGPPAVAELCDEMGIYLIQELPIDWGTNFIHDPEWIGPILTRLEGGVRRDRHHPSIMLWAVGNENMPETEAAAADGWNHLRICDQFVKQLDGARPTMFPPPGPANKVEAILGLKVGDIADTHYSFKAVKALQDTGRVENPLAWDGAMETVTREQALERGWSGVWFSSEYGIFNMQPDLLNSPYLSIISDVEEDILSGKNTLQVFIDRMRYEWGMMRDDPTCLGGAFFPWMCAGAGSQPEGNPWGWVRWGEDADWGVVTADLLPKPFFWAMRVFYAPIVLTSDRVAWKKGQTSIAVEVRNLYNSYDLAECTLRTMMGGGGKWMGQMREFRDIEMSCPPGQTATLDIPIWNPGSLSALENGSPIACRLVVLDPDGFRPLTTDILVLPPEVSDRAGAMPIGPDAEFEG